MKALDSEWCVAVTDMILIRNSSYLFIDGFHKIKLSSDIIIIPPIIIAGKLWTELFFDEINLQAL